MSFIPVQPPPLPLPFAANGDKADIPAQAVVFGRASLADGFPVETQVPLNAGGVPPSRLDINGALYPLYLRAMWEQSGGMAVWSALLNYTPPAMIIHEGKLYISQSASGPDVAGVGAKEPGVTGSEEYWLDYAASITPQQRMDPVGGIRFFEDEQPRPGYVPCMATTISNFSKTYPEMAAYLSTPYGATRLVTLAQYNTLHTATWATLADGSTVGWNGIGGVTKFVWDKAADTLKMPDLQEMFRSSTGASLGVGAVHGDMIRNISGTLRSAGMYGAAASGATTVDGTGAFASDLPVAGLFFSPGGSSSPVYNVRGVFNPSRVVPTGAANAPRCWGALACAYLGIPVL